MLRFRAWVYAVGLVGSPLLILGYWILYPAYGDVTGSDVIRDVAADPDQTRVADIFAFAGTFLAIPAILGFIEALRRSSPRLALIGGGLALLGWTALIGALMTDVVAVELVDEPALFDDVYGNPFVIALNALVSLHIVGGVLIGVATLRTRLLPAGLAVALTAAPVVHLASNLAGQLWLDSLTWLVTATAGAMVARILLRSPSGEVKPAAASA